MALFNAIAIILLMRKIILFLHGFQKNFSFCFENRLHFQSMWPIVWSFGPQEQKGLCVYKRWEHLILFFMKMTPLVIFNLLNQVLNVTWVWRALWNPFYVIVLPLTWYYRVLINPETNLKMCSTLPIYFCFLKKISKLFLFNFYVFNILFECLNISISLSVPTIK